MAIDRGTPSSKTRAAGEFSFAHVRIGEGRLRGCTRAGQRGCRNQHYTKNFQLYHGLLLVLGRGTRNATARLAYRVLRAGYASSAKLAPQRLRPLRVKPRKTRPGRSPHSCYWVKRSSVARIRPLMASRGRVVEYARSRR